jgi:hypothetical protein
MLTPQERAGILYTVAPEYYGLSDDELYEMVSEELSQRGFSAVETEGFWSSIKDIGSKVDWKSTLGGAVSGAAAGSAAGPYGAAFGFLAGGTAAAASTYGKKQPTNKPPSPSIPSEIPQPPSPPSPSAISQPPSPSIPSEIPQPPSPPSPSAISQPPSPPSPSAISQPPSPPSPSAISQPPSPPSVQLAKILNHPDVKKAVLAAALGEKGANSIQIGDKSIAKAEIIELINILSGAAVQELAEHYSNSEDTYNFDSSESHDPQDIEYRAEELIKLLQEQEQIQYVENVQEQNISGLFTVGSIVTLRLW